jgi:Fic family protein
MLNIYNQSTQSIVLPKLTPQMFEFFDSDLENLSKQAYFHLGILRGKISHLMNKELLLMPLVVMESVKSSNIESINSTVLDQFQADIKGRQFTTPEQKLTENYREALLNGFEYLQKSGRFDLELILLVQKSLIPEQNEIRDTEPVVIANTATGNILWRPPVGQKILLDYLANWLDFVNKYNEIDTITKVGILHSQFEAIHPFVDGNGRTGRILIILFLVYKGLLTYPCLFISDYILKTRTYYYMALQDSQTENKHLEITKYLTKAILEKAQYSCNLIEQILELKAYFNTEMSNKVPAIYSIELLDFLFQNPFYTISSTCQSLEVTRNTATKYLKLLVDSGLIQVKDSRKNKLYFNPTFLKLLS